MTTTRRIIIAAISAAVALGITTCSALAAEFNVTSSGSYLQLHPHVALGAASTARSISPTIVHITTAGSGFHWGDAAIGAAAAVAIVILLIGCGLAVSQRHPVASAPLDPSLARRRG
jgi:hypothetical protein